MTETVVVTGIGCWTGLGNFQQTWQQLLQGNSSISRQQPFPNLPSFPLSLLQKTPSSLSTITAEVVNAALADAGLNSPLPDCGVAVGSSRGCQGEWEKLLRQQVSPLNWLEMLPHQAAIATAQMLGSTAMVLSPMAACSTGIWTIAQGYELIQRGDCEQVVAGAVESPITPLTLTGFNRMGALAKTGCYPFDKQREGLVLGEGGAVLVLESLGSAKRRNASIYGQILGFGLSCDAYHLSAPNPDYQTASLAVKNCFNSSAVSPHSEVDYIHAHGTSTQLNDTREAALIQSLFPSTVAVSSTKGATGHTLGASSAIAAALTLMALQQQILPPCVGLKDAAFDLNLVEKAIHCRINTALVFSFGFGGQNGAIMLSSAP